MIFEQFLAATLFCPLQAKIQSRLSGSIPFHGCVTYPSAMGNSSVCKIRIIIVYASQSPLFLSESMITPSIKKLQLFHVKQLQFYKYRLYHSIYSMISIIKEIKI